MTPRSATSGASVPRPATRLAPTFDGYPYLVTRIGHSALRHMALLPADWSRERLVELARRQAAANRLDTCLALGPSEVVYITADGAEYPETYVPTGIPVVDRLRLPEELPTTPELEGRRARLRAYTDATTGPGYIVGDNLEGGRPATPDDLRALAVHDGNAHPGLARCATCQALAGDFLATTGQGNGDLAPRVIRVHCACENHNRCARCGETLADSRLSAYYFVERSGQVCYVAAYCAFSHRCAEGATSAASAR